MTYIKTLTAAFLMTLGLGACAAQSGNIGEGQQLVKSSTSTVKPGAAVTMKTTIPENLTAQNFHQVKLNFSETQFAGDLNIRVEPSAGLNVFGSSTPQASFKMASADIHEMAVDVSAPEDGIYFLNVFAEANGLARAFSVTLEVGDITDAMRKAAFPENGELQDGVRVLQAQETIR